MQKLDFKNLDKKLKIEIAITSAVVIALIVILANSIKTVLRAKGPLESPAVTPVTFKEIARGDISISDRSEQVEKAYKEAEAKRTEEDAPWGRDPFALKISSPESSWTISGLRLEGIMWDEENPYAIINGGVVKKGDKIGKNTVLEIEKNAVVISDGTKRYRLLFW